VAKAFATGDLSERIELDTHDEITELAKTFNTMAGEIQGLINSLERRVAERTTDLEGRTKELEIANENIQRRASQFEALAQVSQSISTVRDLQKLLPQVTSMVNEKYGFYHVGIFLLDEVNQYAVLAAANSAGGQKMLERQHRLKVGEQGIVGSVTSTGEPRIALDVGKDAVFFNNPDLPDTHSEMALPLQSGGKVIGALDVQSTETGAFTNEDLQTLTLLANQVTLAIENARLFEEENSTLDELQTISRQSTRDAWKRLPQQQKLLGYRYNAMGASPLKDLVKLADTGQGKKKAKGAEAGPFVVPIELRGEVIGSLLVQSPAGKEWNSDEQDIIKAVAERVALSAENARLFEETNQRAERERLVSDITSKIRSHNDPQAMIETAVNELRNALGASRVEVIPQKTTGGVEEKE
jgi:GAF domain-containing protein